MTKLSSDLHKCAHRAVRLRNLLHYMMERAMSRTGTASGGYQITADEMDTIYDLLCLLGEDIPRLAAHAAALDRCADRLRTGMAGEQDESPAIFQEVQMSMFAPGLAAALTGYGTGWWSNGNIAPEDRKKLEYASDK